MYRHEKIERISFSSYVGFDSTAYVAVGIDYLLNR